jgi:hypothetical protein
MVRVAIRSVDPILVLSLLNAKRKVGLRDYQRESCFAGHSAGRNAKAGAALVRRDAEGTATL